jgi:hypothetical protein
MNTNNFVRIGNVIINVNEISSVELDAGRQYGPRHSLIIMRNGNQYSVFKSQLKNLFGDMIPEEMPEGSFDDSEFKEEMPQGVDDHYNADGSFNYNNKYGDFPCYE